MKRRARFLGQFERICQTFFTKTHNLKINPEEPGGFGVRSLSGAFICFHPGLDHVMVSWETAQQCGEQAPPVISSSWSRRKRRLLLPQEEEEEEEEGRNARGIWRIA